MATHVVRDVRVPVTVKEVIEGKPGLATQMLPGWQVLITPHLAARLLLGRRPHVLVLYRDTDLVIRHWRSNQAISPWLLEMLDVQIAEPVPKANVHRMLEAAGELIEDPT